MSFLPLRPPTLSCLLILLDYYTWGILEVFAPSSFYWDSIPFLLFIILSRRLPYFIILLLSLLYLIFMLLFTFFLIFLILICLFSYSISFVEFSSLCSFVIFFTPYAFSSLPTSIYSCSSPYVPNPLFIFRLVIFTFYPFSSWSLLLPFFTFLFSLCCCFPSFSCPSLCHFLNTLLLLLLYPLHLLLLVLLVCLYVGPFPCFLSTVLSSCGMLVLLPLSFDYSSSSFLNFFSSPLLPFCYSLFLLQFTSSFTFFNYCIILIVIIIIFLFFSFSFSSLPLS